MPREGARFTGEHRRHTHDGDGIHRQDNEAGMAWLFCRWANLPSHPALARAPRTGGCASLWSSDSCMRYGRRRWPSLSSCSRRMPRLLRHAGRRCPFRLWPRFSHVCARTDGRRRDCDALHWNCSSGSCLWSAFWMRRRSPMSRERQSPFGTTMTRLCKTKRGSSSLCFDCVLRLKAPELMLRCACKCAAFVRRTEALSALALVASIARRLGMQPARA